MTVAIVGGGFSGAMIALQLARSGLGRILVFEPRAVLGQGLAYSTQDPAHRINAPACRMSVYPDDPDNFSRWLAARGEDDPAGMLPDGRAFPRRAVFGAYVADQLAPWIRSGRIVHVQAAVERLEVTGAGWVVGAGRFVLHADVAVLATGHPPAAIPAVFRAVATHPGFVADPGRPGALAGVGGRVLIVGTGLTMADIVATLHQGGRAHKITALSRRGQVPREHAAMVVPAGAPVAPCATAAALVRAVRAAVVQAQAQGQPWQSVFDALRCQAAALWAALPVAERRRLLRHVRPFWESHRFRLAPATADSLRAGGDDGWLVMAAGTLLEARAESGCIRVTWRVRGGAAIMSEVFDSVVLSIGAGKICETKLIAELIRSHVVAPDPTGLGLQCAGGGFVSGAHAPLCLAGPLTRGVFGEMTGVPEIAYQAVEVANVIVRSCVAGRKARGAAPGPRWAPRAQTRET
jgi:uncharacterized NAD(P)/FAD-binding protein YdhS